eukprot:1009-Heterococcus_DN1.PRE.5
MEPSAVNFQQRSLLGWPLLELITCNHWARGKATRSQRMCGQHAAHCIKGQDGSASVGWYQQSVIL